MFKLTKFLAGVLATGSVAYADDLPVVKTKTPEALSLPAVPEAPAKLPTAKVPAPITKLVQEPVTPMTPKAPETVPPSTMTVIENAVAGPAVSPFWGSAEYGLFRMKASPMPNELYWAVHPSQFGALFATFTRPALAEVYGGQNYRYGNTSGLSASIGGWITADNTFGVEGTYTALRSKSNQQSFAEPSVAGNGAFLPFIAEAPGLPAGFQGAGLLGGVFLGLRANSTYDLNVRFSGWGARAVYSLSRDENSSWEVLAGYRHLSLDEELVMNHFTVFPGAGFNFTNIRDYFGTTNKFHGAQVGLRRKIQNQNLSFEIAALLAMGVNRSEIDIQGSSSLIVLAIPNPHGFYAQQSNIGIHNRSHFSVVPELNAKLSYNVTERVGLSVGYQGLYWTQVIRPGNTVDNRLNATGNGPFPLVGAPNATSATAPPHVQQTASDFWVHGLMFGLNLKY